VRVFWVDLWRDPARAKAMLGVLPDDLALPERLTGREVRTYLGLLYGLEERLVAERAQELLVALTLYAVGFRTLLALVRARRVPHARPRSGSLRHQSARETQHRGHRRRPRRPSGFRWPGAVRRSPAGRLSMHFGYQYRWNASREMADGDPSAAVRDGSKIDQYPEEGGERPRRSGTDTIDRATVRPPPLGSSER
jgi:hypothetical protein